MELYGWTGKVLYVDLSQGEIKVESLPTKYYENYLGGAGLNARLLYDHYSKVGADLDPLAPRSVVIFGSGSMNGTLLPSSGRLEVTAKSPVTGIFGDSNCGGDFAPEMKYAGFDHIIITGRAAEPVYLWIDSEHVEICSAKNLWGKTTWEADELLKDMHQDQDIKTALIGPAAENGVLYGTVIVNKYRACGKTGTGSVVASKNLKGIAIRGRKDLKVRYPEEFIKLSNEIKGSFKKYKAYEKFGQYGTMMVTDNYQVLGKLPVKNRQEQMVPPDIYNVKVGSEAFKKIHQRDVACFNCPIHCSSWLTISEGKYKGFSAEKLEFVAVTAFGIILGNYDLQSIVYFHQLSNKYGFDCMEFGNTLAVAMEAFEKGLLTEEQAGMPLDWGNQESIEKMIEKTAKLAGFGEVMAQGVARLVDYIGPEAKSFSPVIKGYGTSYGDPRNGLMWGLAYTTATRGGDHLKAFTIFENTGERELAKGLFGTETAENGAVPEGKGKATVWGENISAIIDSLGVCKFSYSLIGIFTLRNFWLQTMAATLSALTGVEYDEEKLFKAGERIWNVEKAFNTRLGLNRKDDILPERLLREPPTAGARKGKAIGNDFFKMLDDYYQHRGWNVESGLPTEEKLCSLDLEDIAADLTEFIKPKVEN